MAQGLGGLRLHTASCLIGLFTLSWDRLANVTVGTYNVKLPVLAFFAALATTVLEERRPDRSRAQAAIGTAVGFLCLAYAVGVALAVSVPTAAVQAATVILGALVPFLALSRTLRFGVGPGPLLTALISGAVVASLFGFYQLAAFYTGLPNPLPYTGLGGGAGRIAAFSYEPAYFAYFLILAIAAWFAREVLTGERHRRLVLAVLAVALVLSNSRAAVIMLPLLLVLMFARARHVPGRRSLPVMAVTVSWLLLLALMASDGLRTFLGERVASIVSLSEPTSNAPRIEVFGDLIGVVRDHWMTGVGPGNLFVVGWEYGMTFTPDASANSVVANNIWLQALVDGGILLALAHLALVVTVAWQLFRLRLLVARTLIAGWLSVVLVGGMLTSYFYDVKLWVVLGLAVGLAVIREGSEDPDPVHAARGVDVDPLVATAAAATRGM